MNMYDPRHHIRMDAESVDLNSVKYPKNLPSKSSIWVKLIAIVGVLVFGLFVLSIALFLISVAS